MNFIENFDTLDLIAVLIVGSFCIGSLYGIAGAENLKELSFMVGTFFFAKQTLLQK